jgi:hypothetical protein
MKPRPKRNKIKNLNPQTRKDEMVKKDILLLSLLKLYFHANIFLAFSNPSRKCNPLYISNGQVPLTGGREMRRYFVSERASNYQYLALCMYYVKAVLN